MCILQTKTKYSINDTSKNNNSKNLCNLCDCSTCKYMDCKNVSCPDCNGRDIIVDCKNYTLIERRNIDIKNFESL